MLSSRPTTNTSKIYMLRNSQWKTLSLEEKDSSITKVVKKDPYKLGRKGRDMIRLGPVPLGGDIEDKADYIGLEILPGE